MVRRSRSTGGSPWTPEMAASRMINEKQYRRLLREFARTNNMSLSALSAGVDRKTARKYLNEQRSPEESSCPHTWRTRADPLEGIWPEAEKRLLAAPELEAKALFERNRPADPSRRRWVKAAKWPSESNDAAWEGNRAAENGGRDSIHSPGAPAKRFVAAGLRPEAWVLLRDAAAVAGHP